MGNFEIEIARCLNRHMDTSASCGFAYRLKQGKYSYQYVDVLVDSLNPEYYLAIECKSLKGKRINFKSNFHFDKNGIHQIDMISNFLGQTGRRGYLAVEFRFGTGKPKEAYLMPWDKVLELFRGDNAGIGIDEFRKYTMLGRTDKGGYLLHTLP